MRYLFLDIEWINMFKKNHIISLAAFIMKGENCLNSQFNSKFCPAIISSLKDNELKMFHTNVEQLREAEAFRNWIEYNWHKLLRTDAWVFWSKATYNVFKDNCLEHGYIVKDVKIIVLQDLLAAISIDSKDIKGFEKYMDSCGCWFDARASHESYYDVACLQNLYWKYRTYCRIINENNKVYLLNTASNVLHTDRCGYVSNIKEDNKLKLGNYFGEDAYVFCKKCMKNQEVKRFFKLKDFISICQNSWGVNGVMQEACLENICSILGIKYKLSQDMIELVTKKATWKIYHYKNQILNLFHENSYTGSKRQKRKIRRNISLGFHCQNIKFKSVRDACLYIYMHDYGGKTLKNLCVN